MQVQYALSGKTTCWSISRYDSSTSTKQSATSGISSSEIGPSPHRHVGGLKIVIDSSMEELKDAFIAGRVISNAQSSKVSERNLAFVEIMKQDPNEEANPSSRATTSSLQRISNIWIALRPTFKGNLVTNWNLTLEKAAKSFEEGKDQAQYLHSLS